jgi:2-keto-4-pentenoate hydratase/2-oxohepta-3-ene-1,7-dioic acid hydratase in catechol pathway
MKVLMYIGIFLLFAIIAIGSYLNRGLKEAIVPADLTCLSLEEGQFAPFDTIPSHIYGVGLAYAKHINETASSFDPDGDPPIFLKSLNSRTADGSTVKIPSHTEMLNALELHEPGISKKIAHIPNLPALLDYETELGFVLLEDISKVQLANDGFIPKIGFYMANDFGARSVAILGEGQPNRYDYWGVSKSFRGFTPISDKVWIPNEFQENAIPCIMIETLVNEELRQHQMTSDLIYTPLQMLQAIDRKYPSNPLKKGDLVLTGTPGGVIMSAPRWMMRAAAIVGLDRFAKLKTKIADDEVAKFLHAGDQVVVRGDGLGSVSVTISE